VEIAEKYVEMTRDRWHGFLVKRFAEWLQSRGISTPTYKHVNEFLEEYRQTHAVSSALHSYRRTLKKFVEYVQQLPSKAQ